MRRMRRAVKGRHSRRRQAIRTAVLRNRIAQALRSDLTTHHAHNASANGIGNLSSLTGNVEPWPARYSGFRGFAHKMHFAGRKSLLRESNGKEWVRAAATTGLRFLMLSDHSVARELESIPLQQLVASLQILGKNRRHSPHLRGCRRLPASSGKLACEPTDVRWRICCSQPPLTVTPSN